MIFPLTLAGLVIVAGLAYVLWRLHLRVSNMSNDFSKLQARVAANTAATDALIALIGSPTPPSSDQATIDELTSLVEANTAAIDAKLAPATPVTSTLVVTPAALAVSVGQPVNDTLTVSGGTAPYTFTADDGLLVDTGGGVTGEVATAGESAITVSDSSSPVQTATVSVTAA